MDGWKRQMQNWEKQWNPSFISQHCPWQSISIAHTQCLISADSKAAFLTHVILLGHGPCFTHVQAEVLRPERHYSMYQSSLEITRAVKSAPNPPTSWTFEVSATFTWRTGFGNIPQQIQWSYKVAERAFIRKMKLWLIYMFLHLVTQHTSCNHIVLTFHKSHIRPVPLIWSTYT